MAQFHDPAPREAGRIDTCHTWRLYPADHAGDPPPYPAPAGAADVRGLPATYLSTVEYDCLRDQGWAYTQRLVAAGPWVEFHHYAGAFHAFDLVAPTAVVSWRAIGEQVEALRRAFLTANRSGHAIWPAS